VFVLHVSRSPLYTKILVGDANGPNGCPTPTTTNNTIVIAGGNYVNPSLSPHHQVPPHGLADGAVVDVKPPTPHSGIDLKHQHHNNNNNNNNHNNNNLTLLQPLQHHSSPYSLPSFGQFGGGSLSNWLLFKL